MLNNSTKYSCFDYIRNNKRDGNQSNLTPYTNPLQTDILLVMVIRLGILAFRPFASCNKLLIYSNLTPVT